MNQATINQLDSINQLFYEKVGTSFDQTRNQPWQGWQELEELFTTTKPKSILDIGCGNARLATFLSKFGSFSYVGLDRNQQLLDSAIKNTFSLIPTPTYDSINIIELLKNKSLAQYLETFDQSPKWVTLFGVLHHIPSLELRQQLFSELSKIITVKDSIIVSCWQFSNSANLWNRRIDPAQIGLKSSDLEAGDYILDWQRQQSGYRYCHLITPQEIETLAAKAQLNIAKTWQADGKHNNLNNYYLLQKKS